jgi:hypothetical protein
VKCGYARVSLLAFADDIVLLADSKKDLELMLEEVFNYSVKWRFKFNYDKCNTLVFDNLPGKVISNYCSMPGNRCTCQHHFRFGPKYIKEILVYKYLGIELDNRLSYKAFQNKLLVKARSNMVKLLYMGKNYLSVKASINVYQAIVRSLLEYGSEIWGFHKWNEGEQIQYKMAKRILHASATTCQEVLLGDLGGTNSGFEETLKN